MVKPDEANLPTHSDIGTPMPLIGDAHIRAYRETDGEEGYLWNGVPILLLTTIGRKTGLERTIPIIFTEAKDKIFIIGSQGGHPDHPLWYLNILANPKVKVQIKAEIFDAVARPTESPEREELWDEALKQWPNYDIYQSRTTRKIPVVVLDRA